MKKGQLKQFCSRGHDTFAVGKDRNGYCKQCKKEWQSSPKNQFCPKGHDTFVTGRYKNGHCVECKKEWSREYIIISQPQFCMNGHDTNICGRHKNGKCAACDKLSKQKGKERTNLHTKKRLLIDSSFRLKKRLRSRLREVLKENKKQGSAIKNLGCTIEFLKRYLEFKFHDGMTWDNWGKVWQLDHVVALWRYDLTDKEQFLNACHYTNLQPLTIEDHNKKSSEDLKDFFAHQRKLKLNV